MINIQRALTIYRNKGNHVNRLKKSINIQANKPRKSKISEGVRALSTGSN